MVKIMDRLLLFIFSLAVIAASFIAALVGLRVFPLNDVSRFIDDIYEWPVLSIIIVAASAIILLMGLRMLYISLRRASGQSPSISQRTEFGDIQISVDTVENLSLKAASRIRGVKDLKSRIRVTDAGLEIVIRSFVDGETSIPNLSEEIQRAVKSHVEEITGIPVALVSVYVANVTQPQTQTFKSRVE
ncbi:alkaline shock response membrane anchor protein AmaP [Paenibacillus gansuensis]|uniref:Alkaline shock response membrane anchor protein AmaP n=1 Tax=Paenibacillus gansuensis TaxID=306542 RepID=A0ABW5P9F5_9BACL